MKNRDPRKVYNNLAVYFGQRQADSFIKAATAEKGSPPKGQVPTQPKHVEEVFESLFGDSHDFLFAEDLVKKMMPKGKDFIEKIRYMPGDESFANYGAEGDSREFFSYGGPQGWGNFANAGGKGGEAPYCANTFLDANYFGDANAGPVRVSAFQSYPADNGLDASDTDIASLFLNAIPTLTMSRAVPYLDIKIFDEIAVEDNGNFSSAPSISLSKFLDDTASDALRGRFVDQDGSAQSDPKNKKGGFKQVAGMEVFTTPQTMVNADAALYSREKGGQSDKFRPFMAISDLSIQDTATGAAKSSFKTASLNLVLFDKGRLADISRLVAPRRLGSTMFQITYGWSHPDGNPSVSGRLSDENVKNRIGDLIDSMKVTETYKPSNSTFSFEKDGSVKISLELVMAGTNKVSVTSVTRLGYQKNMVTDMGEIAKILDKVDQYIKNQSQSMDDLEIDVPAFLLSPAWESLVLLNGKDLKALNKFLGIMKGSGQVDLVQASALVLGLLDAGTESGGKVASLKKDRSLQAKRICDALRHTPDPFLRVGMGVTEADLNSIDEKGKPFPCPDKKPLRTTDFSNKGKGTKNKKKPPETEYKKRPKQRYVSYGKLMMYLISDTLLTPTNDVQFVFSPFNKDAGGVYDYNISQFPIPIDLLQKDLEEELKQNHKFSISDFVKLVGEKWIEFQGAKAYGLSKIYEPNIRGKDSQGKLKKDIQKKLDGDRAGGKLQIGKLQSENLHKLYGKNKRADPTFVTPLVNMRVVTRPAKKSTVLKDSKVQTITRVYFFDECCGSSMSLGTAMSTLLKGSFFYKEDYSRSTPTEGNKVPSANHQDVFNKMVALLVSYKIIVALKDLPGGKPDELLALIAKKTKKKVPNATKVYLKEKLEKTMVLSSDHSNLKSIFFGFSPYLLYGTEGSGIIEASLESEQNDNITSIAIANRVLGKEEGTAENPPIDLPLQVHPATLGVKTFGCPFLHYGQKYFIDFGTGTTLDNYYAITEISHTISTAEFSTNLKLTPRDAYGRFINMTEMPLNQVVQNLAAELRPKKKEKGKPKPKTNFLWNMITDGIDWVSERLSTP